MFMKPVECQSWSNRQRLTMCFKQKDARKTKEKRKVLKALRRARSRYCCSQVSSTGLNFEFHCYYLQESWTGLSCNVRRARSKYCCPQVRMTSSTGPSCKVRRARSKYCCSQVGWLDSNSISTATICREARLSSDVRREEQEQDTPAHREEWTQL